MNKTVAVHFQAPTIKRRQANIQLNTRASQSVNRSISHSVVVLLGLLVIRPSNRPPVSIGLQQDGGCGCCLLCAKSQHVTNMSWTCPRGSPRGVYTVFMSGPISTNIILDSARSVCFFCLSVSDDNGVVLFRLSFISSVNIITTSAVEMMDSAVQVMMTGVIRRSVLVRHKTGLSRFGERNYFDTIKKYCIAEAKEVWRGVRMWS